MPHRRAAYLSRLPFAALATVLLAVAAGVASALPPAGAAPPVGDSHAWSELGEAGLAIAVFLAAVGWIWYRGAVRRARSAGEMRFRDLLEAAPLCVTVQREGQILYVNRHGRHILRLPPGENLPASTLVDLAPCPDVAPEAVATPRPAHLRRPDGTSMDILYVTIDGVFDGQPARLSFFRDASAEMAAKREISARRDESFQAQKVQALGVLAGGIAHDFNNILQAILGFTTLAREDAADPKRLGTDLDRVQRAAERGRDLVQNLIRFSRPGEPQMPPLDPAPAIESVVNEVSAKAPAGIEIRSEVSSGCGLVRAAPQQLRQCLLNLVSNGVQALESTGGTLTIRVRPWTVPAHDAGFPDDWRGRTAVEFAVIDTGPGIAEAHRARLFDPFFTTREVGRGTGLGLSVVHGLVTGLGGRVQLECPPGGGTVAAFYLPQVPAPAPPSAGAVDTGSVAPGSRILFVDDEADICILAQTLLARAGYEVEVAGDGLAAAKRLTDRKVRFDVLVTDQSMPGLNGHDLAVRAAELRPGLPVILVSGMDEPAEPLGEGVAAFREVVTKPFRGETLCQAVRRALASREGPGAAPTATLDSDR